jgi:hypothetical protein
MKNSLLVLCAGLFMAGCGANDHAAPAAAASAPQKDTLSYAFKASYSSDISVPGNPAIAQKVLQVWKMFETARVDDMKPYFADTVVYNDARGMHFYGKAMDLLAYAKKDIDGLDSMRFDISMWQCAHINDKNEDWVNIWSAERRYPRGGKPDTALMQENWQVKDGKVVYFDQYLAREHH